MIHQERVEKVRSRGICVLTSWILRVTNRARGEQDCSTSALRTCTPKRGDLNAVMTASITPQKVGPAIAYLQVWTGQICVIQWKAVDLRATVCALAWTLTWAVLRRILKLGPCDICGTQPNSATFQPLGRCLFNKFPTHEMRLDPMDPR
eukprot:scaffold110800_cov31-Tisochrysis_lutea.AAC.1